MESIQSIKDSLLALSREERSKRFSFYEADERKGVQNLIKKLKRDDELLDKEIERIKKLKEFELKLSNGGLVCGVDEVGRGPLAGPVVTAAVVLPIDSEILYINDSKKLSKKKREELYDIIISEALCYRIGLRSHERIDEINIRNATIEAMEEAVNSLEVVPAVVLVDALTLPKVTYPQKNIIKGDAKSYSIGAASIVAKVTRDRMMEELDSKYPGYGFSKNSGYGTKEHMDALREIGPSEIHRKSFLSFLEKE
ncbi:MAG: ribonuclease HII [Lachnospiraceae bacterium]|nr:ribonuclease HII [Lachnospiraceae bacterium]